jgi:hypothetical protein
MANAEEAIYKLGWFQDLEGSDGRARIFASYFPAGSVTPLTKSERLVSGMSREEVARFVGHHYDVAAAIGASVVIAPGLQAYLHDRGWAAPASRDPANDARWGT